MLALPKPPFSPSESVGMSPLCVRHWLLVVGLVAGTATQLRIGPVGLSEVFLVGYIFISVVTPPPQRADRGLLVGLAVTTAVIAVGEAVGAMLSSFRNAPSASGGHDIAALTFAAAFAITVSRHEIQDRELLRSIWTRVVVGLTLLVGACLALGQAVRSVGSITFWYAGSDRFVGLSANPNQIPVFFGWMPAATVFLFKGWQRWALIAVQLAIGLASRSDGFQLAQAAALTAAVLASGVGDVLGTRSGRGALFGLVSVGAVLVTLPFTLKLINERTDEALAGGGNGRSDLVRLAIDEIQRSPIFGHGPGAWIVGPSGKIFEAHNNYLDLALQGGIVALGALVLFQGWALIRCIAAPALAGSLGALVSFGMTGLQLRWPIYWFVWLAAARLAFETHREQSRLPASRGPEIDTAIPPPAQLVGRRS